MYRSDEDIALLTDLAGVLDQTVAANGLSAGTYLLLRELIRSDENAAVAISSLAETLDAPGDEVAEIAARLIQDELAAARPNGITATDLGRARARVIEDDANAAMLAFVMDRPHTATIYGLVASMQSGRFTVEDLIAFISEGPTDETQ